MRCSSIVIVFVFFIVFVIVIVFLLVRLCLLITPIKCLKVHKFLGMLSGSVCNNGHSLTYLLSDKVTYRAVWGQLKKYLRVQPAVVGCGEKLFVLGGRNSNKVFLSFSYVLIILLLMMMMMTGCMVLRSFFKSVEQVCFQVELMSAEKFDPATGRWEMVKEMHRKR